MKRVEQARQELEKDLTALEEALVRSENFTRSIREDKRKLRLLKNP
jgi:hypothetical protein